MARQVTCRRIILFGLCIYIFLSVYFLLAIISTEKEEFLNDVKSARVDSDVGFVPRTDTMIDVEDVKYQIKIEKDILKEIQQKEIQTTRAYRTRKPTKPPRSKATSRRQVPERFRQLSTVHQNFSEIAPKVYVYSAFLDDRYNMTYIRLTVVAPTGRGKNPSGIFCMFSNREKTELVYYETCESHLKRNAYYIMSCTVPMSQVKTFMDITAVTISPTKDAKPERYKFISVVNNRGIASNEKRVMREFGVCVPPLFGNVNVLRLVEFIELTRLLGSQHFTFYTYGVADDVIKVLNHYKRQGVITHMPWFIPVGEEIWYKGQSAAVGDCLLRNMHVNELVSFNDIDEFIMPHTTNTWKSLIQVLRNKEALKGQNVNNIAVYRFQSAFFQVPESKRGEELSSGQKLDKHLMDKFVSLSRITRPKSFNTIRTKMLAYPLKVFELGIHHLSKQLKEEYFCLNAEPEVAFLHHYRKCDSSYGTSCINFVEDTTALQFKGLLINNTIRVLKDLKYSSVNDSSVNEFAKTLKL